MQKLTFTLALTLAMILGGCATKPTDNTSGATSSTKAESAPRTSTSVAIPAIASKKLVMSMTGPKSIVESKDWAEFKREWRETFADHAKTEGVAFSFVEGEVKPQGVDGTVLEVNVADYRIIGIGARIFFGVMTGNAFIDAKIKFANLRDGTVLGEQQHNTSSSAWAGVFAKVTPQQVDAIASEVFRDIKAAK